MLLEMLLSEELSKNRPLSEAEISEKYERLEKMQMMLDGLSSISSETQELEEKILITKKYTSTQLLLYSIFFTILFMLGSALVFISEFYEWKLAERKEIFETNRETQ